MPRIECERCGEEFDTNRDGGYESADTTRCQYCGQKHDIEQQDESVPPSESVQTDGGVMQLPANGATIRITIDIIPSHEVDGRHGKNQ